MTVVMLARMDESLVFRTVTGATVVCYPSHIGATTKVGMRGDDDGG